MNDVEIYVLSTISIRRLRKKWDLLRTRQQKHTFELICDNVQDIRKRFLFRGAKTICKTLRGIHGQHVLRELITKLLKIVEPLAVEARKRCRFKRK